MTLSRISARVGVAILTIFCGLCLGAIAQTDLPGIWEGNVRDGQESQPLLLEFEVDDSGHLSGSVQDDPELPILPMEQLRFDEGVVTFTTRRTLDGVETTIEWTGQPDNDQMPLDREIRRLGPTGGPMAPSRIRGRGNTSNPTRPLTVYRRPE
jgi:hypothetical protein